MNADVERTVEEKKKEYGDPKVKEDKRGGQI